MVDNCCEKGYPKEFSAKTTFRADGYPSYRRRADAPGGMKGLTPVDARDVVPYNPYLSSVMKCHLNVEFCASIKSVKYLYKYTYKGHDRANMELALDEIARYLDARYVGPPEACWRLFQFPLHGISHAIQRLAVHVERQQRVVFRVGEEREALASADHTTLLDWFSLNARDPVAREMLYQEIPTEYAWSRAGGWRRRGPAGSRKVLGRLHSATPEEGERFNLYLLLLHVRGATSFEDLRTVGGKTHDTFRGAAEALGLVDSNAEHRLALSEAASCKMPVQMRALFAHLLLNTEVTSALDLWQEFKDDMAADFRWVPADRRTDAALADLQARLERGGTGNAEYGLPLPDGFDPSSLATKEVRRELDYDREFEREEYVRKQAMLNEGQRRAFDAVVAAMESGDGGLFFVDGPAGSGKTFLYEVLLHRVRADGDIAVACVRFLPKKRRRVCFVVCVLRLL